MHQLFTDPIVDLCFNFFLLTVSIEMLLVEYLIACTL